MWTAEFENDSTLGVMEDCYNSLSAKGVIASIPFYPIIHRRSACFGVSFSF